MTVHLNIISAINKNMRGFDHDMKYEAELLFLSHFY